MPSAPPCIVCIEQYRAGAGEDGMSESLRTAAAAGFRSLLLRTDALLLGGTKPISEAVQDASAQAGLSLLVETDISRFSLDHPLVEAHPALFALRRSGASGAPVDPRRPMPAVGEARARLRQTEAADALLGPIRDALLALVDTGVRGFRFAEAGRIPPAFLKRLILDLKQRDADLVLFAGPPGLTRPEALEAVTTGLDFLVSSFGWWDYRAAWLIEEMEALRVQTRLVAESRPEQIRSDNPATISQNMLAAAASASGVILPLDMVQACPEAASRVVEIVHQVADYCGEMRRLSGSAAPVTALLRTAMGDVRTSQSALLVLINTSVESRPAPDAGLLHGAGAAFAFDENAAFAPLMGGEVRILEGKRSAAVMLRPSVTIQAAVEQPRLVIEDVTPRVDGGDFPVKRVAGERIPVDAKIFADGHEQLAAEVLWRPVDQKNWTAVRMEEGVNDCWHAEFAPSRMGRHEFCIESWIDCFGGFRRDLVKKLDAGVAQPVDYAEGRLLVEAAQKRCKGKLRSALGKWAKRLAGDDDVDALLSSDLAAEMYLADDRPHRLRSASWIIDAERLQARFSSWYELFPRSQTSDAHRHGSFADVVARLPAIRDMGFDTLYFPPIHPIGLTNRKGLNNSLTAGSDDPGSPYAIGSEEGGHTAIHPELGSFEDFAKLIDAAHVHGLEIALDFAIQCSPDHPWLKEHPGWFDWRPDGSLKYAENPPKKYQDIVNVDFYQDEAIPDLWLALRDTVLFWIDKGVKAFRVDNPHTKPLPFWEWMIADVRARHPDAIFLAEAFTRPAMMYRLAKIGFSQSYTYFTWRESKAEFIAYITELTTTAPREFYRPHFFVNTPDINPYFLQTSGRPGFRIRAVLAATLSGLFGVYSGFELCEAAPVTGKEEYLHSEKYEIRPRDWAMPGNIVADITLLNRLRRSHPALQTHLNTRFLTVHNDAILYYAKPSPDGSDMILVMVNLDPHKVQEGDFEVPLWEFSMADDGSIGVEDLASGNRFRWHGKMQHVRIDPEEPYRLWRIAPGADI